MVRAISGRESLVERAEITMSTGIYSCTMQALLEVQCGFMWALPRTLNGLKIRNTLPGSTR